MSVIIWQNVIVEKLVVEKNVSYSSRFSWIWLGKVSPLQQEQVVGKKGRPYSPPVGQI